MKQDAVILNYSAPGVFYAGSYKYGSWQTPLVAAGIFAFAMVFGNFALRLTDLVGRYVVGASSAACTATAAYLLYLWLMKREYIVRITEEGIEHGRKIWTWPHIDRLGGIHFNGGIAFEMTPKEGKLTRQLFTSPALTIQEFTDLFSEIREFLAKQYPHVSLNLTPRTAD